MGHQGQERRRGARSGGFAASPSAAPPSRLHAPPALCCSTAKLSVSLHHELTTVPSVSPQFPVHQKQKKAAAAAAKAPKFYPSEDAPVALKRRNVLKPARLRPSITPGTVSGQPWVLAWRCVKPRMQRGMVNMIVSGQRLPLRPLQLFVTASRFWFCSLVSACRPEPWSAACSVRLQCFRDSSTSQQCDRPPSARMELRKWDNECMLTLMPCMLCRC